MTMGMYWAWETTATLRLFGGARGAGAPTGGGEGRVISCRHAHSLFNCLFLSNVELKNTIACAVPQGYVPDHCYLLFVPMTSSM